MNRLTLSVAGGGKTQGIVNHCDEAGSTDRILILTYTLANQDEISSRLAECRDLVATVRVQGWFSFLLSQWVKPYLPCLFPGQPVKQMDFHGDPGQYAKNQARFFDHEARAYKRHLARLATEVNKASNGAVLDRLSRIYDRIWIDEVQDLNGYDLCVLELLLDSGMEIEMVGDIRQAILQTNARDPKYKQYRGPKIKGWFDLQEENEQLVIEHQAVTSRCNLEIASFADTIFDAGMGFQPTVSRNDQKTDHDGIFAVATEHAAAYAEEYGPVCLRYRSDLGTGLDLPFINIGESKGTQCDRVLILPTKGMEDFVESRKQLKDGTACSLYVAATRARYSVALLTDKPDQLGLNVWPP